MSLPGHHQYSSPVSYMVNLIFRVPEISEQLLDVVFILKRSDDSSKTSFSVFRCFLLISFLSAYLQRDVRNPYDPHPPTFIWLLRGGFQGEGFP